MYLKIVRKKGRIYLGVVQRNTAKSRSNLFFVYALNNAHYNAHLEKNRLSGLVQLEGFVKGHFTFITLLCFIFRKQKVVNRVIYRDIKPKKYASARRKRKKGHASLVDFGR